MKIKKQLPSIFCQHLQKVSLQFGGHYTSEKKRLLQNVPPLILFSPKDIKQYHDTLLSMIAWPENHSFHQIVMKNMQELSFFINKKIVINNKLGYSLSGTGIAHTDITGHFSYEITKKLIEEFGLSVSLHSWDAKSETIKLFFRQLLPRVEYESIFSGELSPLKRIKKLKGKSSLTDLQWLMKHIEQSPLSDSVKDFLFNELKIFITWKLDHPEFSRSFLNVPCTRTYYHHKLERIPDFNRIVSQPLPHATHLSAKEKEHLVNVARVTLVFLYRETDPFTFASAEDIKYFNLEKGISIALYSLKTEHRLSIESYIGYLVCKNGIPIAYGGGWLFGKRCQFGINILAPFRGGESAIILLQLIRVYKLYYQAERFVVKPYQFGKNNKEGLESGAFWFYYKYGFRPVDEKLQQLAYSELEKKKADNNYRTPVSLLKKFTHANLQLLLTINPTPVYDASELSKNITNYINKKYDGDRVNAMNDSLRETKKLLQIKNTFAKSDTEKKVLKEWSLIAAANLNIAAWNKNEKKQLTSLIKAKTKSDERTFITQLQTHRRLWSDLNKKFI